MNETKKLFYNKYPYKVVICCQGVYKLRNRSLDDVYNTLSVKDVQWRYRSLFYEDDNEDIAAEDRLKYLKKLIKVLKSVDDHKLRIEYSWMSIYLTDQKSLDKIIKVDTNRIQYVCIPTIDLKPNELIMADDLYDYRITISASQYNHTSFVEWADSNKNIKVPPSSAKLLTRDYQHRPTYFYVKGDKQLSMVRLHLGSNIQRIEKIIGKNKQVIL